VTDSFPCTSCGICCTRVGKFPTGEDFALADGRCRHLQPDNRCGIYESRPEICRVKDRADKSAVPTKIFYKQFAGICNQAQKRAGVPVEFRVSI
jgi:Fe-S-cluster containining protein